MLCLAFEICCSLLSNGQRKPGRTWEACEQRLGAVQGRWHLGASQQLLPWPLWCPEAGTSLLPRRPPALPSFVSSFHISCPGLPVGWCPVFFMGSVSQWTPQLHGPCMLPTHQGPTSPDVHTRPWLQRAAGGAGCVVARQKMGLREPSVAGSSCNVFWGWDVKKSYCRACCMSRRNKNRQGWRRTRLACS